MFNEIYRDMCLKLPGLRGTLPTPMVERFGSTASALFDAQAMGENRRRRIWELSGNLHCSIIGTCLTTAELRQVLIKIGLPGAHTESDHELHGRGVLLSVQKGLGAKLLQKALDRRHRSAIAQFSKARDAEEVRALWWNAVRRADIPGGYWAVLTHPQSTEDLVRIVFGEVHMLSHLVGAANRADIRRLRELEAENAMLQEKVARQQRQLRDTIRDATIAGLNEMLGKVIVASQAVPVALGEHSDGIAQHATAQLIAELRRRVSSETESREKTERRLATLTAERDSEKQQRRIAQQRELELRQELELVEASLSTQLPRPEAEDEPAVDLQGTVVLYVGGRAHQIPQMRALAERAGASFLYHDGGIEDRTGLLEAQLSRADIVFFPVDCVSHNAVATVKRVSRYRRTQYLALRTSGLTSLAAALRTMSARRKLGDASQKNVHVESPG